MKNTDTPSRTPEQIRLAQQTLATIEANPKEWSQVNWRCETGMCFAGHAAMLAGREWAEPENSFSDVVVDNKSNPHAWSHNDDEDVYVVHVREAAREALGLDDIEAFRLFAADNTLDDLRAYVGQIAAGQPLLGPIDDDKDDYSYEDGDL